MRKINLDRPHMDSKEILARKNFSRVLENHQIMAKPFFKSAWFFGSAGVASVGLLIGGAIMLSGAQESTAQGETLDSPPLSSDMNHLLAMNTGQHPKVHLMLERTLRFEQSQNRSAPVVETATEEENVDASAVNPDRTSADASHIIENDVINTQELETVGIEIERNGFSHLSTHPRISGKISGPITRHELLDKRGLTTNAELSIVHFELHLVEGSTGAVFEQDGNQLTEEMIAAIDRVMVGENIYFENIRGKSPNGEVFHLNPLRYVLMN